MCRPNKALNLNGFKRPKVVFECSLEHITFLGREERRQGRRKLGLQEIRLRLGFASHFFLLRDQETYKKRCEEVQGNKSNPKFILFYLDFGEKP